MTDSAARNGMVPAAQGFRGLSLELSERVIKLLGSHLALLAPRAASTGLGHAAAGSLQRALESRLGNGDWAVRLRALRALLGIIEGPGRK